MFVLHLNGTDIKSIDCVNLWQIFTESAIWTIVRVFLLIGKFYSLIVLFFVYNLNRNWKLISHPIFTSFADNVLQSVTFFGYYNNITTVIKRNLYIVDCTCNILWECHYADHWHCNIVGSFFIVFSSRMATEKLSIICTLLLWKFCSWALDIYKGVKRATQPTVSCIMQPRVPRATIPCGDGNCWRLPTPHCHNCYGCLHLTATTAGCCLHLTATTADCCLHLTSSIRTQGSFDLTLTSTITLSYRFGYKMRWTGTVY